MLNRYIVSEINNIWEDLYKFNLFHKVELAHCQAQYECDYISQSEWNIIKNSLQPPLDLIQKKEQILHHETLAFLEAWKEYANLQDNQYIHKGLTSSDILDTVLSLQIQESSYLIIIQVKKLLLALEKKALQYKLTPMIGRSHGIVAETITVGLKFAGYYDQINTWLNEHKQILESNISGVFSGAVGNYLATSPTIEAAACRILNLPVARHSTQVISRDKYSKIIYSLALLASIIENIATEFRHLQRSEVNELEEYFVPGQKGSSAMPHKKNPWRSENLCGLARIARSYVNPSLENITLWHERDMSHSSAERIIFPDLYNITAFMLERLTTLFNNMTINTEVMLNNINYKGGIIHSQACMLALMNKKHISREQSYSIIQQLAHKAMSEDNGNFFEELINKQYFSQQELNNIKDKSYMSDQTINKLFSRIFE